MKWRWLPNAILPRYITEWVSKMKKTITLVLVLLGLYGICIFALSFVDYKNREFSTITNPVCQPPCWYGIYPGKSTELDVMTVLTKYEWINQNSVHNQKVRDETIQIRWLFRKPVGDIAAYVYFSQKHVALINIMAISLLDIKNTFAQFGQPKQVVTYVYQGEIVVILIYPEKGVFLMMEEDIPDDIEQNYIRIQENKSVSRVGYFDPTHLDELLNTSLYGSIPVQITLTDACSWQEDGVVIFR